MYNGKRYFIYLDIITAATYLFIFEQTNIFALLLTGRQITTPRLVYMSCHLGLLLQMIFSCGYIPLMFLSINHSFDIAKYVCNLFTRTPLFTNTINIMKTLFIVGGYIAHLQYCDYSGLIIPCAVTIISVNSVRWTSSRQWLGR